MIGSDPESGSVLIILISQIRKYPYYLVLDLFICFLLGNLEIQINTAQLPYFSQMTKSNTSLIENAIKAPGAQQLSPPASIYHQPKKFLPRGY